MLRRISYISGAAAIRRAFARSSANRSGVSNGSHGTKPISVISASGA